MERPVMKALLGAVGIEGAAFIARAGAALGPSRTLKEGEWCVALPQASASRICGIAPGGWRDPVQLRRDGKPYLGYVFPAWHIDLEQGVASAMRVMGQLAGIPSQLPKPPEPMPAPKSPAPLPEELDERGLPKPWVVPSGAWDALGDMEEPDEADAFDVGEHVALAPLAPLDEVEAQPGGAPSAESIRETCARIAAAAGVRVDEWVVRRGKEARRGFTSGKVWFSRGRRARRVLLVTCPNSDLAEVAATAVHELSHAASQQANHGRTFRETAASLAAAVFGDAYFAEGRARIDETYRVVDGWLATGIRAALRGADPPQARRGDESLSAATVSRIRKLCALAASAPGTPEAVSATAIANDLVVTWGLGGYAVRVDARIEEQMCDRWLDVGRRIVWRRALAFAVAELCNVFALSRDTAGIMHLFGKYGDVVAAEYLFGIASEGIERACEAHLRRWRREDTRFAGESREERTSFCDSAVVALQEKITAIRRAERSAASKDGVDSRGYELTAGDLRAAEELAAEEYRKRGRRWCSARRRGYRPNSEGYAAGKAIQLVRGLAPGGERPRRLPQPGSAD